MADDCANVDVQMGIDSENYFVLYRLLVHFALPDNGGRIANPTSWTGHSGCSTKLLLGHKHWARQRSGNALTSRQVNAKAASQSQHGSDWAGVQAHHRLSVPAIAATAHAANDAVRIEQALEDFAGVLRSLVRVMQYCARSATAEDGHQQGIHH